MCCVIQNWMFDFSIWWQFQCVLFSKSFLIFLIEFHFLICNSFYNLKKFLLHHLHKLSYLFDPLAKAQKIEILKEPKKKANAFGEFARVRTYSRVLLLSSIAKFRKKKTFSCPMNFIWYLNKKLIHSTSREYLF